MTALTTEQVGLFVDEAEVRDTSHRLDLIAADGSVLFSSEPHSRALCEAMAGTLLYLYQEAHGWELIDLASGECVLAGVRGEGAGDGRNR